MEVETMSARRTDDLFKSFSLQPFAASTKAGEVLDLEEVIGGIKKDVVMLTDLANWHLDFAILDDFKKLPEKDKKGSSNSLGRKLGIKAPKEIRETMTSGASRFSEMLCAAVIDAVKSWNERIDACSGLSQKQISQGWKRTSSPEIPKITNPKMRLSAANNMYSYFEFDPLVEGEDFFILNLVVQGTWTKLYFDFDTDRFSGAYKITKPDITLDKNELPVFNFTAAYTYNYTGFSEDYVIGVDVGTSNYVTASVVRKDGTIVEGTTTTLSSDIHSLVNKVRNANKQVASLQRRGKKKEAFWHRIANVHRKRELAIKSAQEIAMISAHWGNAIVVFEDLSWIKNTMQNGKWNRGELVRWTKHFVELNGGRIAQVNAAYTSKVCHLCNGSLMIIEHHDVWCENCGLWMDRDENATANIAQRFINRSLEKFIKTRKKSKKFTSNHVVRVKVKPVTKRDKNPDRTKFGPTPKRPKRKNKRSRQKVFTSSGLEVTTKKIGSSGQTETEDGRKKQVPTVTVKSSHNRKFRRRFSSCSLIQ